MKELNLLKQLQSISSTNEKVAFVSEHKDNQLFITLLKFIINDRVITNISRKKFNKDVKPKPFLSSVESFLYILENKCSGSDNDISVIKGYLSDYTPEEQSIWAEIVCKDLSLGMGVKIYNKAVDKKDELLDSFYMGCSPYNQKDVTALFKQEPKLLIQTKEDGQYIAPTIENGRVIFNVRKGAPIKIKGRLVEELLKVGEQFNYPIMLQGELLIKSIPDRSVANGVLRGLISSTEKVLNGDAKEESIFFTKYGHTMKQIENDLEFAVWDLVSPTVIFTGKQNEKYKDRFEKVKTIKSYMIRPVDTTEVTSDSQAFEIFMDLLSQGKEGVILKSQEAFYQEGKRKFQLKYKIEFTTELKIVGYNQGRQNTKYEKTLGALICESECGKLRTKVSGLSEEMRDEFWTNQDKYLGKIVEVKCNGLSKNKEAKVGLYYPNFVSLRTDKNEANAWEEIVEIQESIKELKRMGVK
jgi:hypothetical protein